MAATRREAKARGYTHMLLVEQDNGSERLLKWYAGQGFVELAGMDRMMVAEL